MIRFCPLLFVLLVGCSIFGSESEPELAGTYEITTQRARSVATFDLDLSESGQEIDGTGTLTLEDTESTEAATYELVISGEHEYPDLFLQLVTERTRDHTIFEATVQSSDRAEGTITFPNGTQMQTVLRAR